MDDYTIRQLQDKLKVDSDGIWGSKSSEAAKSYAD